LKGTTLDEIDMKILNVLTRNSRVSYNSLGKEIGLTAKSAKARVRKCSQAASLAISFAE
jgi:DNA-binding Lrp family transcriptional regulator